MRLKASGGCGRASVSPAMGQRLVDDTDSVGEDGGGKLSSSNTATPTLLRRVNMQDADTHLLVLGLYFSMELRLELPSLPPTAYSHPSMATRSWVLLGAGQAGVRSQMGHRPRQKPLGMGPQSMGGASWSWEVRVGGSTGAEPRQGGGMGIPRSGVGHVAVVSEGQTGWGGTGALRGGGTAHLRMFMGATLSQAPALGLYLSTELRQLVPSLPPAT